MNIKIRRLNILSSIIIAAAFSSCIVTENYTRTDIDADQLYRIDGSPHDSLSAANLEWTEIFSDTILQRYIRQAIDSNIDVRIAVNNIKTAYSYMQQSGSLYFPSISLQPYAQYQILSSNTPQGISQNKDNREGGFLYGLSGALSWEADIWGKINSQQKASLASYLNAQYVRRAIKSQLIALVAQNYYKLLAADAQKDILNETILSRRQSLTTIKALKDAGTVTEAAVKQNEAQLFNVQAQLVVIENNIRATENATCMLLAQNPQPVKRGKLTEQTINTPLATGAPYQLLSNRPDVRAAEYNLITAFEMTNVARANFYPSLTITASGGLLSSEFDKIFSAQSLFANVIGSLTQPIWNQSKIRSQYEISLAQRQSAYLNYRKSILTAGKEVSDALFNYDSQNKLLSLKDNEFLSLDAASKYSGDLLQHGMATYLDVLTAQQNALNAKLSYINANYGKLEAIIDLYRALGGGGG